MATCNRDELENKINKRINIKRKSRKYFRESCDSQTDKIEKSFGGR